MALFSRKEKVKVKAVHESDFENYLKSLNIYDAIIRSETRCQFCGAVITIASLQAVVPCDEEICFVCNNPKCINQIVYDK